MRRKLEEALKGARVRVDVAIETTYGATVCSLALGGLGVGIVNSLIAADYASRGLVIRPLEPSLVLETYLLYPISAPPSNLALHFEEVARKVVRRDAMFR